MNVGELNKGTYTKLHTFTEVPRHCGTIHASMEITLESRRELREKLYL
jgi:hypothetical protein